MLCSDSSGIGNDLFCARRDKATTDPGEKAGRNDRRFCYFNPASRHSRAG